MVLKLNAILDDSSFKLFTHVEKLSGNIKTMRGFMNQTKESIPFSSKATVQFV